VFARRLFAAIGFAEKFTFSYHDCTYTRRYLARLARTISSLLDRPQHELTILLG
jgi:hypothetical protein